MAYTVISTEKTTQYATEHETKAMLYLMNFKQGSEDIFYFVVDFFNDVTGIDSLGEYACDIQSKSSQNLTGKTLGRYLVTLFKNHLSDLMFTNYILFIGGITEPQLNNSNKKIFDISNFTEKAQKSIFKGLKEESKKKIYVSNKDITDNNLNDFISKVTFVIGNKSKAEAIKEIVQVNPMILPKDEYLDKIFNEIRDAQSSKKNQCTENITINALMEFERYKKHLTSNEIKNMILSRLVHRNGIKDTIPISFMPILNNRSEPDIKELVEECQNDIFKILHDKNNAFSYWELFEEICIKVTENANLPVQEIYGLVDKSKLRKVHFLNFNSAMFFISLVKDGLKK